MLSFLPDLSEFWTQAAQSSLKVATMLLLAAVVVAVIAALWRAASALRRRVVDGLEARSKSDADAWANYPGVREFSSRFSAKPIDDDGDELRR